MTALLYAIAALFFGTTAFLMYQQGEAIVGTFAAVAAMSNGLTCGVKVARSGR